MKNLNYVNEMKKLLSKIFYLMGRFSMSNFKTLREMSELWGISERRINTLCLQGRIKGAIKFGNVWAIPAETKKPKDERVKNGRYIKTKTVVACAE